MFTLPLDDIIEGGLDVEWKEEPSSLATYIEDMPDIDFAFEKALESTARVSKIGPTVTVVGQFHTTLRLRCSRCLEEYSHPLSGGFDVALRPSGESLAEEDVELGEEDMESSVYEDEKIQLSEIACEQVFLEIPYQPLCREDCKGLCPVCGKDRNRGACECRAETFETGFAALRNLKIEQ
jgi:uncharacterized protein